ncbi:MAG TPA: undecaprenyl-phosphate glucose phosphotransferase [Steroidobacteraceae bacterium]|nr:undecaprenyl-phosphate glucose phosphotransferase [Steroidobacteraceae bacterium]
MAAVVGSVGGSAGDQPHKRVRFGSIEPALLSALKQLDPLMAVITLGLCALIFRVPLTPQMGALAVLTYVISSHIFGKSNRESELAGKPMTSVFSRIVIEWICVVCILLFAFFAFKVSDLFSRAMMLTWFAASPLSLYAAHALRLRAKWAISNSAYAPSYIIVGANSLGFELFRRLPRKGFLGFFDFRSPDRVAEVIDPAQLVGHCKDVAEFVRAHGVTSIYIALPLSKAPRIGEMIRELRDTTASVYFIPDVFAFDLIQGRLVEINGLAALSVCDTPFYGMDAIMKRVTDVLIASLALLVLSPFMLLIALAVKLTSKGPVLFRQRRYGLNGEEIMVYKFRSMTVCEDGAVVTQATKHDQRVTPLGRILRATSLDELPQLLNVLEGKMSVVGPRPHAVAHNEQYRKLISGYMIRHKVRPGITGLAQVNGLRGETETVEKMRERVRYDLEYLSHWSPWLDVKIIAKTIAVLWRDKNAY